MYNQSQSGEIALGMNWNNHWQEVNRMSPSPTWNEESLDSIRQSIELEQGEEYEEEINIPFRSSLTENTPIENIKIGNRKIDIDKFKERKVPIQTEKLTIYLNKNLIITLKLLKKNKSIKSFSQCISEALVEYLTTAEEK